MKGRHVEMKLNRNLNANDLNASFETSGRAHVPSILEEDDARRLLHALKIERTWNLVFFANGRHFDLSAEGWRTLEDEKKATTLDIVHREAAHSFGYMYDNIPVYDRYHGGGTLPDELRETFEFLNGEPFLDFARTLTGASDIGFADAQATRYGPSHFLTLHDDDVSGKNRRAAFVLNLTEDWREDWGGYLQFFDEAGHVVGAYKPLFNVLNVFRVPARHSVGVVAPFARAPRYSITGWLRAGEDPGNA